MYRNYKCSKREDYPAENDFFKYFSLGDHGRVLYCSAMIFSNVVGNVFSGAEEPAWGKFLGALVFSIAVLLISLVGGELFTGNNLDDGIWSI